MKLVYSLGGSILAGQDSVGLQNYASEIKGIAEDHEVYVVVGGGRIARDYIQRARAVGASEAFCDELGIMATKMNAMLLIAALGSVACAQIPTSYPQALESGKGSRVVVMGGISPGQTTDAVSALLAEYVGADRLIIATSVDGVYTADPEVDPYAKKLHRMTPKDLVQLTVQTELKAGSRSPVDPLAAKIIERSRIPTAVVLGSDLSNLKKGMSSAHKGTEISTRG
jgi:uridylate kinase